MKVESTASALLLSSAVARSPSTRQYLTESTSNTTDTVRISQAARDVFAASTASTTPNNDKSVEARLAEISAKSFNTRTADEIDYMQKATGLVNTFAHLSSAEKAIYDKAVASGNTEAAEGIAQIAFIRQGGEMAGGANGTTYNPRTTDITVANIEKYFSHGIVDPTGNAASKFRALIQFLQANSVA